MRMFQVDAFTNKVFAGNPAAVLVLTEWLDDALMLEIAQENNLAETAFTVPRQNGGWHLRWFTPTQEVDFCGHATLATAHILASEYNARGAMVFETRVGELRVTQEGETYCLDIPRLDPEPINVLPIELDGVFQTQPAALFRNFENIYADLGTEDAVRAFKPDLSKIAKLGAIGLVITGEGNGTSGADFASRSFAPGAGIPEDPVTGSTHATLVPYWADRLGRDRLRAFQASARGGWLDCELTKDRVFLRGNAVTYMDAHIRIFDTST